MVIAVVSPPIPSGPGTATTGPAHARPLDPSPPLPGRAAVTAATPAAPSRAQLWPDPPSLPAPLKGLGIPPLNTRQVGDFDRLDEPAPPPVSYAPPTPPPVSQGLDLRR
jgi:hypothetical protein